MKKQFIHSPVFYFLSPIFNGIIVYLLILLVNNNITQLQEQFLGEELYLCVGMSYIVQELSRLIFIFFNRISKGSFSDFFLFNVQIVVSIVCCVIVTTASFKIYYHYFLNFPPSFDELRIFNIIFCVIILIYNLLYISHRYLFRINTEKLVLEYQFKDDIEEDFKDFEQGINPNLLFESLESLLVLIKKNAHHSDEFLDSLARVYRYILSSREKQLATIEEEMDIITELVCLFNHLPCRHVMITNNLKTSFLIVPRSLLFITELIIRTTIVSQGLQLEIVLDEAKDFFKVSYREIDKITDPFKQEKLQGIKRIYKIYSEKNINVFIEKAFRVLEIPKLTIKG